MPSPRVGVFVCHCGKNIAGVIDVEELADYASTLPDVVFATHYKYMCSDPGTALIKDMIKKHNLNRIVVAACSPTMHEATFQKAMEEVGLNPYYLEVANIREQVAWVHMDNKPMALKKAKDLVRMAVSKARLLEPLEKPKVEVKHSALVIGGGIAGIQAALDLADQGIQVYLVEKSPSIGGRMAQLDKTFPTLDCSSCILTPKMSDAGSHPFIELLTNSEVDSVEGCAGDFKVRVRRKATYVDWDKCTGCGECILVCRMKDKVVDEFNMGLGKRGAIYIPFPQAVPLKATIDPDTCLMLKYGKCGPSPPCIDACEANAIDHSQKDTYIDINVGAIIVATGFDLLNAEAMWELGYGKSQNVITTLEFERLVNSSGPTGGEIIRPSDGKEVKSVTFVLCVGSRDESLNTFCCRIGCMVALKHAYLLKEHLGPEVEVNICFNDIRAFGRDYEEFYRRIRGMGINFIRGRPSEIRPMDDGQLNFDVYDTTTKKFLQITSDLVVLVPTLVPRADAESVAKMLRISQGADGFYLPAHPKLKPVDTNTACVFIAGCCTGPKDIPDTVAQASAAAARAATVLRKDKLVGEVYVAEVNEDLCSGCGVCENLCPYGAIDMVALEEGGAADGSGDSHRVARVNPALCEGCGTCVAACPSGALDQHGFKEEQIIAMIDAAMADSGRNKMPS